MKIAIIKIQDPRIVRNQSHESSSPMFSEPVYDPLIIFLNQAPILVVCSLLRIKILPLWVSGEKRKTGFPPEMISSNIWRKDPKVKKPKTGNIQLKIIRPRMKKIV